MHSVCALCVCGVYACIFGLARLARLSLFTPFLYIYKDLLHLNNEKGVGKNSFSKIFAIIHLYFSFVYPFLSSS